MQKKDGLSREDRERRITSVKPFSVIDNSKESLLNQLLEAARTTKYYDAQGNHAGYFDELLKELKAVAASGTAVADGNMEPSQALLYAFLEQLYETTALFNNRWNNLANWYLNDYLGVVPLPTLPDNVWLTFTTGSSTPVMLNKGTAFNFENNNQTLPTYRLTADLEVQPIQLVNAYSLMVERSKDILPAAHLNFITSVTINDLLNDASPREYKKALGILLTGPSLLLREGKRCVTLTFTPEEDILVKQLEELLKELNRHIQGWTTEKIIFELFNNVFYITVSTPSGWQEITDYTVKTDDKNLILKFMLPEDFPSTTPCEEDIHHFQSPFPALRIFPNFDAWLYPYSWMQHFLFDKIIIETTVQGISNILIYNELGRVDNSKPFLPFGVNTERGAWFVFGNYEMSRKNTQSVNLHIKWQQLPDNEKGLLGHYRGYTDNINNRSYQLKADCLVDYNWYSTSDTQSYYLFTSIKKDVAGNPLPDTTLSQENSWQDIDVHPMPVSPVEEEYDYNIKSRSGFIRLVMDKPSMGFGEKQYRYLFTQQITKNALRKKKQEVINSPINPLIEKVTMDYHSRDVIDLRKHKCAHENAIFQLYPLGYRPVLLDEENRSVSFLYQLDTDANILLSFSHVKGGENLTIFFDFMPDTKERSSVNTPHLTWYWGNGYNWYEVSPNTVLIDDTQNMLLSGQIKLRLPDKIDDSLLDADGLLWLRAGINKHQENIPMIKSIHINVAKLELDTDATDKPPTKLPGILSFQQISTYSSGRGAEKDREMQIRISEYVTHRGKAVTPRDYEQIVLQAFPGIGKVKCLPNEDGTENGKGTMTLVVLPQTPSFTLLEIEKYMLRLTSAYVKRIRVINPVYEELMVRCDISFYENCSLAIAQTRLSEMLNHMIAPWQTKKKLPVFGRTINMKKMHNNIQSLEVVKAINHFSVIHIENKNGAFRLYEYGKDTDVIVPKYPYIIFIPAESHIIGSGISPDFGVTDMVINNTFIIGE